MVRLVSNMVVVMPRTPRALRPKFAAVATPSPESPVGRPAAFLTPPSSSGSTSDGIVSPRKKVGKKKVTAVNQTVKRMEATANKVVASQRVRLVEPNVKFTVDYFVEGGVEKAKTFLPAQQAFRLKNIGDNDPAVLIQWDHANV